MPYYLGVDAGGTKTLAVVCDDTGAARGVGRAGGANYQDVGVAAATRALEAAVTQALAQAQARGDQLASACFGVSGADREVDFTNLQRLLQGVSPTPRFALVNDTLVALRAGTADGVGVCCIGGTGANCIGRNRHGAIKKVGGLGWISGDSGSAGHLVTDALTAALWGAEGRGPATALHARLLAELDLAALDDVVERGFFNQLAAPDLGHLAPLVFELAAAGDAVAVEILRRHGRGVAQAALCAIRALFEPRDEVPVVLGGSVLARGQHDALRDAIAAALAAEHPAARLVRLAVEPVLGALLLACDAHRGPAGPEFTRRLQESYSTVCAADPPGTTDGGAAAATKQA